MNSYIFVCETNKKNLLSLVGLENSFSCRTFWKPQHWLWFFELGNFLFLYSSSQIALSNFCFLSKKKSFFLLCLGMEAEKKDLSWRKKKKSSKDGKTGCWTVFYLEIEFCSLMASLDFALWLQKAVGSNPRTRTSWVLGGSALGSDRASAVPRGFVDDLKVVSSNPRPVRKPLVRYVDLDVETVWINVIWIRSFNVWCRCYRVDLLFIISSLFGCFSWGCCSILPTRTRLRAWVPLGWSTDSATHTHFIDSFIYFFFFKFALIVVLPLQIAGLNVLHRLWCVWVCVFLQVFVLCNRNVNA